MPKQFKQLDEMGGVGQGHHVFKNTQISPSVFFIFDLICNSPDPNLMQTLT